jgi:TPR repeat protein
MYSEPNDEIRQLQEDVLEQRRWSKAYREGDGSVQRDAVLADTWESMAQLTEYFGTGRASPGTPIFKALVGLTEIKPVERRGIKSQAAMPSMDELQAKATAGDPEAQYALGWSLHQGRIIKKNDTEAVEWWIKAAGQGHARAQYRLADAYWSGEGVPEDKGMAVKWYTEAAGQGDPEAQDALSVVYMNGTTGQKNYSLSKAWENMAQLTSYLGASRSPAVEPVFGEVLRLVGKIQTKAKAVEAPAVAGERMGLHS